MLRCLLLLIVQEVLADETSTEVQDLNELPIDKLLALKTALIGLGADEYDNATTTTPPYLESFGAQAMAMKAAPVRRGDYDDGLFKKDGASKISNIFSMSVTTLAFLAFGGYLLCLIVQAVKAKHSTPTQPTFFVNAGIKRPQTPQTHFASYGRRKRESGAGEMELTPEQLFSALLQLCEGYAKWSERLENPYG